jgi:hypothetical protein
VEFRGEVQMDLLRHIKSKRKQSKKRRPLRQAPFARVGGIVRENSLGESFLEMIENFSNYRHTAREKSAKVKPKVDFVPPLFCLLTRREYHLTMSIMSKVDNPYLMYANSPEELLFSKPLFSRNPFLRPEVLTRHHFEMLLVQELEKQHGVDLKD